MRTLLRDCQGKALRTRSLQAQGQFCHTGKRSRWRLRHMRRALLWRKGPPPRRGNRAWHRASTAHGRSRCGGLRLIKSPRGSFMLVLITGGAGYIGSHTAKFIAQAGHTPVVLDNLSFGHEYAVKWGPLERGDLANADFIASVFT